MPKWDKNRLPTLAEYQMAKKEFEKKNDEWPKIVQTYVKGSKEDGYDLGEELGLEGEALGMFTYLHYEVELTIKVQKDGSYTITHVDDFPVSDKMEE